MEFAVLGAVEALRDGQRVGVGHARQQCVLVALLVDAGQAVPIPTLVDRVWGSRVPRNAHGTLQSYLSRLRRVLAVDEDVRILREAGGYVINVDRMAVDIHRFRSLTRQARAATDDSHTLDLLDRALALWRGETLAMFDTPWLANLRASLEQERIAAELDRTDLRLRRGHHAQLLGELTAQAADRPLDERLAGQLMLALYRSGRQADALEHYARTRRRLADELGSDPSPPLRQLHRQILAAAAEVTPPAAALVPRQLPADVRGFTGRVDELGWLDAKVDTAGLVAISGTAGVGKTAMAVHWAHRVREAFPDGQLYVNLRGFDPSRPPMSPDEAVRGFLDAFRVPSEQMPIGVEAQGGLYRTLLAGKRVLVIVDNARDADQIRPLLPGAPGCLVVVTSRSQLSGLVAIDGAQPLTLDLLTDDEARDLLAHRLGSGRVVAEPQAVQEIIKLCGRLPLALVIAAARAATNPQFRLQTLVAQLREASTSLDAFAGPDPATDVRAVLSWSYRTLTPGAARLFGLLGIHPGPDITTPAAASLTGWPHRDVQPLLAELTRAHLVAEHTPGRYALHDLLRAYATELARTEDPDDVDAVVRRMLDHYLHTAHSADRLLYPHRAVISIAASKPGVFPEQLPDRQRALEWFAAERPVLLAVIERATDTGLDVHVWALAWVVWEFFGQRVRLRDQAATEGAALAAAQRLGDRLGQAFCHRVLAGVYARLGRDDEAHGHLRAALTLAEEIDDKERFGHTYLVFAEVYGEQGRHAEAVRYARHARDMFRAASDIAGQAKALNSIGWHESHLGRHRRALEHCQQALELVQQVDDAVGEAATWDSIGYAHAKLGHHLQAAASYQRAIDLCRRVGDRWTEANVLTRLAETHEAAGSLELAHDVRQAALDILTELDHPGTDAVRVKLDQNSREPTQLLVG